MFKKQILLISLFSQLLFSQDCEFLIDTKSSLYEIPGKKVILQSGTRYSGEQIVDKLNFKNGEKYNTKSKLTFYIDDGCSFIGSGKSSSLIIFTGESGVFYDFLKENNHEDTIKALSVLN